MRPFRSFASSILALSSLTVAACGARSELDLPVGQGGAGGATTSTTGMTTTSHTSTTTTGKVTVSSTTKTVSATTVGSVTTTTGSGPLTGPVISQPAATQFDAETSIAIDPVSKRLVSAWIGITNQTSVMGYAFSSDGGSTWTAPDSVSAPGGRESSDPVLAIDKSGAFYMSFVGFQRDSMGQPVDMHVYVSKAQPGGNVFGAPVEVSDTNVTALLYDKPWIVVTNTGEIAVSYADINGSGLYSEDVALSVDGGASWMRSKITNPSAGTFYNLAFLCPDQITGRLHAALLAADPMGTHLDVVVTHTDDQGMSWAPPLTIAGQNTTGENISFDDPTCFAQAGKLFVSYGITNNPIPMMADNSQSSFAIRLAELDANGMGPITKRMDIQDPAAGKAFLHSTIAGDTMGHLAVVYYAGQMDEDPNGRYRIGSLGTVSNVSVHPTVPYTDPIFTTVTRASIQWLGDYTGLVVDNGTAYTSFVTNQNPQTPGSAIAFTKLTLP